MLEETGGMSHEAENEMDQESSSTSSVSSEEVIGSATAERISEEIRRDIEMRVLYYSQAGKDAIDDRLDELDEEWDIERAFGVNAAGFTLAGLAFGVVFGRKWYILPVLAAGCLLQQSLKGWTAPMTLLRMLGFRTPAEIDAERYALKALRGDFQEIHPTEEKEQKDLSRILGAVER
ncbi:MAG: hypothetical protein C4520_10935 [Candidatus Abyssobacteria bacterium SURF_5]|uniref:DUF2892 domain-containing protein n=1 Tax=Abyssobacteria bacterium (strain SURF_5) TaxID=2093360 RepID=A0A3A4NIR2_ABYX5|nr:MAG: hypothetical protein C4520_10935 [Candidatus Abyssubacteria bacterium SURF_5]